MDSMGCMMLRECTKDVEEVHSILDVSSNYDNEEDDCSCTRVQPTSDNTQSNWQEYSLLMSVIFL